MQSKGKDELFKTHDTVLQTESSEINLSHEIEPQFVKPTSYFRNQTRFTSYLETFFNIGFLVCAIPFRIEIVPHEVVYKIHKHRLQQILWGLQLFLASFQLLGVGRRYFEFFLENKGLSKVLKYFDMIEITTSYAYLFTFASTIWFSFDKVKKIFIYCHELVDLYAEKPTRYRKVNMASVLCVVAFATGVIHNVLQLAELSQVDYIAQGRYHLFIDKFEKVNQTNTPEINALTITNILVIVIQFGGRFSLCNLTYFYAIGILISALTLLEPSLEFNRRLKLSFTGNTPDFENILQHFHLLKRLSSAVNDFLGPLLILYIANTVALFFGEMENTVLSSNYFPVLHLLYLVTTFASILTVGSQICLKVADFKSWLLDIDNPKRLLMSTRDVTLLLADLSQNPIGLSGKGIFVLDYSFVGVMSVLYTSLFVVVLQEQSKNQDHLVHPAGGS